ncbi:CPBP family intramembrane glutamic endopeptidase [Lysinibacillus antri]|uniref:CPBP family intramembrane metalloprotease n=1 Tax=Lysinibacillus antri TaxID=2498145 RepID=A0A3S0QQG9_9BACI|nr:CPBP family intramembrane glutamic endopeptidase [Lysinibacillus antri]RUL54018.1 CPBP family intramembrane metalloprotease [Lysinibacillus antri]
MEIINLLLSAVVQVILFSIIPFVWWWFSGKKEKRFFTWLGLTPINILNKKKYAITFALIIIILLIPSLIIIPLFIETSSLATSQFTNKGIGALIPALIYAFLQTGFSEELFFRGFLTKRLIHKFGFQIGNILQGLFFGVLHGMMIVPIAGVVGAIIVIFITSIAGYLMGWINEKQSGGSIITSWLVHGTVNTIASFLAMFNMIL